MIFTNYEKLAWKAPDEIKQTQNALLREHVEYCAEHSPYYRRVLDEPGVSDLDISVDSLQKLPLTRKADLGKYNDEFLAVNPKKIVDIVFSSGTTGPPTRIAYTEHDLERLAYNERQSFLGTGMTPEDTVLHTCTMDRCFVAGLAYYLGVRSVGAASIRSGHAPLESHLQILRRSEPTAIVGVPSFLKKLAECAEQNTINPADMSVKSLVCIGEPVRDENLQYLPLGRIIHEKWGADVYSTYASTEAVTTFCECTKQQGGHLHPELAVIEIVDDQGDPVKPGENGEVVLTPLGTEGMPLIRYRTGDISFLLEEPCGCGRNSVRLGPILGRKKQMIKYKGTTLYPQPIAAALQTIPAIEEHYVEVAGEEALSDQLTIHVAVSDPEWDADRIAARLQSHLRVKPAVVIEELESLRKEVFDPKYRKPMRFVDRRTT